MATLMPQLYGYFIDAMLHTPLTPLLKAHLQARSSFTRERNCDFPSEKETIKTPSVFIVKTTTALATLVDTNLKMLRTCVVFATLASGNTSECLLCPYWTMLLADGHCCPTGINSWRIKLQVHQRCIYYAKQETLNKNPRNSIPSKMHNTFPVTDLNE